MDATVYSEKFTMAFAAQAVPKPVSDIPANIVLRAVEKLDVKWREDTTVTGVVMREYIDALKESAEEDLPVVVPEDIPVANVNVVFQEASTDVMSDTLDQLRSGKMTYEEALANVGVDPLSVYSEPIKVYKDPIDYDEDLDDQLSDLEEPEAPNQQ